VSPWQNSSPTDWKVPRGKGFLSFNATNELWSDTSLTFVGNADNGGVVTLKLDPEGTWNWGLHKDGFLEYYVKANNVTGYLRFVMATNTNVYRYWDREVTSAGWNRFVLPLSTGNGETTPPPDLSNIDYVTAEWQGLQRDYPLNLTVLLRTPFEYDNKLSIDVDGNLHYLSLKASSGFEWIQAETVYLSSGWHNFSILAPVGSNFYIDALTVRTPNNTNNTISDLSQRFSYKAEKPTEYVIELNVTNPFFLVFGESYDDFWIARHNNDLIHPFVGYSYSNAYRISENGQLVIILNFEKQKLRDLGYVLSTASVVFICGYLILPIIKKHTRQQKRFS
jgi:hypothetical protein